MRHLLDLLPVRRDRGNVAGGRNVGETRGIVFTPYPGKSCRVGGRETGANSRQQLFVAPLPTSFLAKPFHQAVKQVVHPLQALSPHTMKAHPEAFYIAFSELPSLLS